MYCGHDLLYVFMDSSMQVNAYLLATWSDITIADDHVLVNLRQSKTTHLEEGSLYTFFQPTHLLVQYVL